MTRSRSCRRRKQPALTIKHCMAFGAALNFTVVTFWATQSVVACPASAASCTPRIVVLSSAIVVVVVVASAVSVVLGDTVADIALSDLACSGYDLVLVLR